MKEYPVQRAAVLKPKPIPTRWSSARPLPTICLSWTTAGQGWHDGRIVPYGPLAWSPPPWCSTMPRRSLRA